MLDRGAWLVPTLVAGRGVLAATQAGVPLGEHIVEKAKMIIEAQQDSIRRAVAAGVQIASGTDSGVTPHGRNLDELPLMVGCGIFPAAALHAATLSAARLMGLADELGSIQPGKRADLEFSVSDLATVADRPTGELVDLVEEAVAAGVLVDAGPRLAFRHPLIRQALYEAMPTGLRSALHRQAAEALDRAGASVQRVAEQLTAAQSVSDGWMLTWLLRAAPAAAAAAATEVGAERIPSRVAADERCRGLLGDDPGLLRTAAARYRPIGTPLALAHTLEDLAALLAASGDSAGARAAHAEAVELYTGLGAIWDLRRADTRLRSLGIRRGQRGARRRPRFGWPALTPTELTIAGLVAEGRSNPDIAAALMLSRRTVETHVSNILVKLDAHSRAEIAREATRNLASA